MPTHSGKDIGVKDYSLSFIQHVCEQIALLIKALPHHKKRTLYSTFLNKKKC